MKIKSSDEALLIVFDLILALAPPTSQENPKEKKMKHGEMQEMHSQGYSPETRSEFKLT